MRTPWCDWEEWDQWKAANPLKRGDVWEVVKNGSVREILIGDTNEYGEESTSYAEDSEEPLRDSEFRPRKLTNLADRLAIADQELAAVKQQLKTEKEVNSFWASGGTKLVNTVRAEDVFP
jgi:hypothetical protein